MLLLVKEGFYKKNADNYLNYKKGSGRDAFRESHWKEEKKPEELKKEVRFI